jgi:catechol 2,3-dioxygenase-like lactoylglutathione lyase family enzyme
MRPAGIHHVNVTVRDLSEAMAFYVGTLGMRERDDRPDFPFGGAWLDVGGQQVHLVVGDPGEPRRDHFAVLVDDLDATIEELRERGLTVSNPVGVAASRQAFLRDPSGNLVELHQLGV